MPCSSRLQFVLAAIVTTALACAVGVPPVLAAPPTAPAPPVAPTLPTDADIAAFYAPFGPKITRVAGAADAADSLFNAGVAALNGGDYRVSGGAFTLALAIRGKFSDAKFDRGIASEGAEKWNFAITDFTAVLAARPQFYDAYVERARSYKMLGDLVKARADVTAAEAIHPERPDAYTILEDPNPNDWKPDPALDGRLAAGTPTVAGFSLRPPKGYVARASPLPSGGVGESVAWVGPMRSDHSQPYIAVINVTLPPVTGKTWTPEGVLTTFLLGIRRNRENWTQSRLEMGTINGIPFAHATWTGTQIPKGVAMRGFGYVAQDGDRFVYVSSQDVEPYAPDALALADTSARTLRKR